MNELARLCVPVTALEMASLVEAIPNTEETRDLHWVARRVAYELDKLREETARLTQQLDEQAELLEDCRHEIRMFRAR